MSLLISLDSPCHLLEVHEQGFTHFLICENQTIAKRIHESSLGIELLREDNVLKESFGKACTLAKMEDETFKVQALKQLLEAIQQKCQNREISLLEGFYYYDFSINQIRYFQTFSWNQQPSSNLLERTLPLMEMFRIFSFLLSKSKTLKQLISIWIKLSLGKMEFQVSDFQKKTITDTFISDIILKQIPTASIASHSLQIIKQKLNLRNGRVCLELKKKQKDSNSYYNLLLSDSKRHLYSATSPRVKQSNSLTSVHSKSSHHGRKYRKLGDGLIGQSRLKNTLKSTLKSSGSFHQSNSSFHNNSLIVKKNKENNLNTWAQTTTSCENWYREESRNSVGFQNNNNNCNFGAQSNNKMKVPFQQDVSPKSQLNLLKILQQKQKVKTVKNVSFWNSSQNIIEQNKQPISHRPTYIEQEEQGEYKKYRNNLCFCFHNVQLVVEPHKKSQKSFGIFTVVDEYLSAKNQQYSFQNQRVSGQNQRVSFGNQRVSFGNQRAFAQNQRGYVQNQGSQRTRSVANSHPQTATKSVRFQNIASNPRNIQQQTINNSIRNQGKQQTKIYQQQTHSFKEQSGGQKNGRSSYKEQQCVQQCEYDVKQYSHNGEQKGQNSKEGYRDVKEPVQFNSQKSTGVSNFEINKQFINLSINFMGAKKLPINKFVVLNSLIVFYVVIGKIKYTEDNKKVMRGTIANLVAKIEQMKGKPRLASHNSKDIEFLTTINVLDKQNFTNSQIEHLTEICFRVLKKEFDLAKNQVIKMKKQLIEKKNMKNVLIFMLRLAICISIVGDFNAECIGVQDFKRGENRILAIQNQALVDLRSQMSNLQGLF